MVSIAKIARYLVLVLIVSFFSLVSSQGANAATATITGRNATLVSSSATTNITGISVGGLTAGATYLVAVGLSSAPAGASLKIQTYTGLTASYGYTAPSIYASFATVSFYGSLTDVNNALASLQYISGAATGSPVLKISASTYTASYSLNGYNGHFYTSSTTLGLANATYTSARSAAKLQTYQGQPGYLVTLTTSGENDFITNNIINAISIWIGATDEVTEGQWRWDGSGGSPEANLRFFDQTGSLNGSALCGRTGGINYTADGLNYSRWASGEPNDYCNAGEDYAVTNWGGTGASGGTWNDCGNDGCSANRAYVIEFGTNAADGGFVNASSDLASNTFSLLYSSNAITTYSASTTTPTYGSAVTLIASVTAGATGTVAFKDASSNALCTTGNLSSGTANCSWTPATRATYAVTAFYIGDGSYLASNSASANIVVSTRPITIKATAKSATYNGSSVSVSNSYSISSGTLVGSETFTAITYTYSSSGYSASQTAPTNAGSYTITPSAAFFSVGSANDYNITYDTATLTIGVAAQAALTISSTSGTYGTTLRLTSSGGSGTGGVTFATSTTGCNITNTDSLTVTSVLTCSVIATKAADSNYSQILSTATNVVFGVRPITIKAVDKTATYNGSAASVTNSYSISAGNLAGSDTFTALTYTYSSAVYSASPTAPTNAGSYTITPSAASFSVGSASNYSITYETATLTISKANQSALTITNSSSKYGTLLRLITSGGSGTGALSFAITSAGTASGCSITTETFTVTSFGTCKVTATKALDTNYFVVNSAETTITFAKADSITVTTTLSSSSVTYTEIPAAITATQTITGLVNSETGTATTTYTGNTCEYGGTCAIGDVAPGGGYVFYVSATTINVAAGISTGGIYLATGPQTWSGGSIDPNASFGCGSTNIAGTSVAVGSGAENTRLINAGCATAGIASRLAADSTAEGFTDWFIPSIDELTLIYNNLKVNSLSNLQSLNYWSSTQGTSSAYGKDWWFGSGAVSGETDKNNSAGSNMYVRPIRAFSPTALASNTIPTDAGVYRVGSTFSISSPATLSNYQGVESVTATLTINKARQKTITIGQYDAYPNISSYPLNVYGGSGPGVLVRTLVSAGTAGCTLVGSFILTATSVGTCTVKAERAGTRNYIVESTTATIYWIAWVTNYATQTLEGNHAIPLNGGNQIVVRTETLTASAFSNTSGGAITSAAVGTTIRINSTGFAGLTPSSLSVTFRPYEDAVINAVTSTYVEVVIPSGAVTGVIAIDSPRGVAYTSSFSISP
jgi:Bacterial Ig-like domain (group 3)/MBG domain (YGX type)/Lectin C-type domain